MALISKLTLATLAALFVLLLVRASLTISLRVPLNYNEGWNAFHAADVIAGRPLYLDSRHDFATTYPPLSFYVSALAGALLGDAMVGGRTVALVSFVVWVVLLARVGLAVGCTPQAAALAALVLGVTFCLLMENYVGVNEPQFLGHALQAWGLLILVRSPRRPVDIVGSALLLTAGVFVKANLVALPIACVLWLATVNRWAALGLAGSGSIVGAAGFLICWAIWGDSFTLDAAREFRPEKLVAMGLQWTGRWLGFLAILALSLRFFVHDPMVRVVGIYAGAAIAAGVLALGGDGVSWNAMFDANWALCLVLAVALTRFGEFTDSRAAIRPIVLLGALALPATTLAASADIHWLSPRHWLDPRWSQEASVATEIAFLSTRPGPVLCEGLDLCFWSGKSAQVDFFRLQQLVRRDPAAADRLAGRIRSREFSALALFGKTPLRDLGPRVRQAIERQYRVHHESEWGVFLVPR